MTNTIISFLAVLLFLSCYLFLANYSEHDAQILISSAFPVEPKQRCLAAFEGSVHVKQCDYL